MRRSDAQMAWMLAAQRGCREALPPLLDSLKNFIYQQARKRAFATRGADAPAADVEDIASEMRAQLLDKLHTFKPVSNAGVVTWAAWQLKAAGRRWYTDHSRTVRVPVHVHDADSVFTKAKTQFTEEHGREPTDDELCTTAGLSKKRLERVRALRTNKTLSLDAPMSEDNDTSRGSLTPSADPSPLDLIALREKSESVRALLVTLNPRERIIVERRFGLDGGEERTLEEVGQELGLTRERVRQLETVTMRKLRLHAHKCREHLDDT